MTSDAIEAPCVLAMRPGAAYWSVARQEIARVLSWQDRESFSRTYGCFDRTYWCWKFSDFPGARYQEGVFALAHLFTTRLPENRLYDEPRVLRWIEAGLDFWQHLQHRDGSFDEAYPFEHSLAATAFTGFYLGEAFLRVRDVLPDRERAIPAFARAGDWLCRNNERHGILSNHLAAAAVALYVIFRITGEDRFEHRCWQLVQQIYDHQSREGWYEEYGGADPGYQTLCTFYLARLWQYTGSPSLLESLVRSLSFLKHCVHPNGTLGGEYGSRNTEFYFPAGCEMLALAVPDAARVARFMRLRVSEGKTVGLATMDAQNMFPMLNNYLFATDHAASLDNVKEPDLPCDVQGEWWFPDAGLLFKSTPSYFAIVGMSKGGVVKAYDKVQGTLAASDCGYVARLSDGRVASTQSLRRQPAWTRVPGVCTVAVDFVPVLQRIQRTWIFLVFRVFSTTVGRTQWVAYWLKNRLVQFLMRPASSVPMRLTRQVQLDTNVVTVTDEIVAMDRVKVVECRRGEKFAAVHMGSSRYFHGQELDFRVEPKQDWAKDLTERGRAHVIWTWDACATRPEG